jgi:predicted dehydrogenase
MRMVRTGIIGCGFISEIYCANCRRFQSLDIVACADLVPERARELAARHGVPRPCSVEELLHEPEIELVLNLTVPKAHASVSLAALEAGKHVYLEKPLAVSLEDGQRVVEAAAGRKLRVGAAPDTFLGAGLQTCRRLLDQGAIGEPVAAAAFMLNHGPESWHPDPEFYYLVGGGPMFDMGPYYLTALVSMLGPVKRVTGATRTSFPERIISSAKKRGTRIRVEVPTHIAGILEFASGAVGTITTSFDVWGGRLPFIEIYGSEGSLALPDPNTFGGPVFMLQKGDREWREMPLTHGYAENSRGLGAADLAMALQSRNGRVHRASAQMSYHVLELMHGFHRAAAQGRHWEIASRCERPAPLPPNLAFGEIDP